MTGFPDQPRDAIVIGDPSGRRRIWWGLGCGFVICLGFCAGGLAWAIAWFSGWLAGGYSDRELATAWPSAGEKHAAMRAGFDGTLREPDDPDLAQIRRLLDRVAAAGEDADVLRELVDFEGLLARVLSYPGVPRFTWLDRRDLMALMRQEIDGPGNVSRFRLVGLDRRNADEVIVYAYASNDDIHADPFRFMLWRGDKDWKLIDWERAETGRTKAEQYAAVPDGGE